MLRRPTFKIAARLSLRATPRAETKLKPALRRTVTPHCGTRKTWKLASSSAKSWQSSAT